MIQLEAVHIEEMRGIRSLDLELGRKNFAISGPNGSGKSGVIDAIEFGLTGEIKRLTGSGTKGLSITEHGPHVDKVNFPGASFVELQLYLPALKQSVSIKRSIQYPKKPEIKPHTAEVREILDAVADHPEITLSRRDIIRFILVEPSKRSQEIQTLLKLDELGTTRAALKTTQNRLLGASKSAESLSSTARKALQLHLQVDELKADSILAAVNERRVLLGLEPIEELTAATKLDADCETDDSESKFNKASAQKDIAALKTALTGLDALGSPEVEEILEGISKLESDAGLFLMIQQRSLVEKGIELVDGPACPLCDVPWEDEDHLRAHLDEKLEKSKEAAKLTGRLSELGYALAEIIDDLSAKLNLTHSLAIAREIDAKNEAQLLNDWRTDLQSLKKSIGTLEGLIGEKARFEKDWLVVPTELQKTVTNLEKAINAQPDQSATNAARSFLAIAHQRLEDLRRARKAEEQAKQAASAGKLAYDTYCKVMESELNTLYEDVQNDFSLYYRELNEDDEDSFNAKFTPTEGALGLDVNFYERGLFPPAAYHSEGHQDGMGVCLYLALMKRLFGEDFLFALLDDVVMSVDADHRYQFCKLLKAHFPNTQFVLTTHDRVWAEQMKSAGLVTGKSSLAFHSWSVDTGPLVESSQEIWEEIDGALAKGKVEIAAASLRRHLEYFATHQCDQLGAHPQFRADGNYELGDLLPAALSRMKVLLGKAAEAAQSWGNKEEQGKAVALKKAIGEAAQAAQIEQWAVNKSVHYNEWANLGKKDFAPVVGAFTELLSQFHCASCDSWLHVSPKGKPESLRCACGALNFNLNKKASG